MPFQEANIEAVENAKLSPEDKKDIDIINKFLVGHKATEKNESFHTAKESKSTTIKNAYDRLSKNEDPKTKSYRKFRNIIKTKILTNAENQSQIAEATNRYKNTMKIKYNENMKKLVSNINLVNIPGTEQSFVNILKYNKEHHPDSNIIKMYKLTLQTLLANKRAETGIIKQNVSIHEIYNELSSIKKESILASTNDENKDNGVAGLDKSIDVNSLSLTDLNILNKLNPENNKLYRTKLLKSIKDLKMPLTNDVKQNLRFYKYNDRNRSFDRLYHDLREMGPNTTPGGGAEEEFIKNGRTIFAVHIDDMKLMPEIKKRVNYKYPGAKITVDNNYIKVKYDVESIKDLKQSI